MRKGKILAFILVAVLTLGIGTGVYFGFINEDTYVSLRMWLAQKQEEKGNPESAEKLYVKILDRRDDCTEAYLALGELYMSDGRYGEAIDLWKRAAELTEGDRQICENLTNAYIVLAEELLAEKKPEKAMDLLESVPENRVSSDDIRDVLSRAYLGKAQNLREAGQLESALRLLGSADPEKLDFSVFKEFRTSGFVELGNAALEKEDVTAAIEYFRLAAVIDPECEEALAALEMLRTEAEETLDSFTVRGTAEAKLAAVVYGGIRVSIPVTAEFLVEYDNGGDSPDSARIHILLDAEASVMGQTQQIYGERYYLEDGSGTMFYECSSPGGNWIREYRDGETGRADVVKDSLQKYHEQIAAGQSDGTTVMMNGEMCLICRDHRNGKEYQTLLPHGILSEQGEDLLEGVEADVVRYISIRSDRLVHVEADLSGSDFGTALAALGDYTGGIDAEFEVEEMRVTADVTGLNCTTVYLPDQVQESAFQLSDFK